MKMFRLPARGQQNRQTTTVLPLFHFKCFDFLWRVVRSLLLLVFYPLIILGVLTTCCCCTLCNDSFCGRWLHFYNKFINNIMLVVGAGWLVVGHHNGYGAGSVVFHNLWSGTCNITAKQHSLTHFWTLLPLPAVAPCRRQSPSTLENSFISSRVSDSHSVIYWLIKKDQQQFLASSSMKRNLINLSICCYYIFVAVVGIYSWICMDGKNHGLVYAIHSWFPRLFFYTNSKTNNDDDHQATSLAWGYFYITTMNSIYASGSHCFQRIKCLLTTLMMMIIIMIRDKCTPNWPDNYFAWKVSIRSSILLAVAFSRFVSNFTGILQITMDPLFIVSLSLW